MAYQRELTAALVFSGVSSDAGGMGVSSGPTGDAGEMDTLRGGVTEGDSTASRAIRLWICLKPRQSLNVPSAAGY